MMDPPKDPNEQPERTQEADAWCAISESPAPAPDMEANLWQQQGGGGAAEEHVEAPAPAAAPGVPVVPWCTDGEHGHGPGVARFLADSPNLCDFGGAGYRFGTLPALGRQGSLELLAESWAQMERYSQEELEGLEQFLILDSDPAAGLLQQQQQQQHPMHPLDTPETLTNDESADVSSSVSIGDTPDEPGAVVTSSCESQGASTAPSSAGILKRKGPVLDSGGAAGASPQTPTTLQQQHQQSMDTLPKKLKGPVAERPSLPRTSRPRYAIQTRTEVDVIDDGYRWRKYGQKPVKNSAHPRNYYRCTTGNCPVRKRVERSTENPSHVLTTYDGTHNHPETAGTGGSTQAREALNQALGNTASSNADQDVPQVPAAPAVSSQPPSAPHGPMPPRIPPSNYIEPNIISHLLAAGGQVPALDHQSRRWSHPLQPPAGAASFQRIIDLLRAHQLFRMQYRTQYPLLDNMLNLMRTNFPPVRPPMMDPRLNPRLDPATLYAPQMFGMRLGGQVHQDPNLGDQQTGGNQQRSSPSTTSGTTSSSAGGPSRVGPSNLDYISMAQRLLWQQHLMGEGYGNETGHSSQQPPASDHSGDDTEGPGNHPDVGDPPA